MKAQTQKETLKLPIMPLNHIKIIKTTKEPLKPAIENIKTAKSINEVYYEIYDNEFSFQDNINNTFLYRTRPRGKMSYTLDTIAVLENQNYHTFRIELEAPCECGCTMNVKDTYKTEIVCPQCGLVHQ